MIMDHHDQGSGVELELGDSTSLKWEEEFVLAAQRLDFIVFDSEGHDHMMIMIIMVMMMIMTMIKVMMMIMIIMHIACFIRLSDGEVEVLPNAVKSYGAISEKVSTRMKKNSFV